MHKKKHLKPLVPYKEWSKQCYSADFKSVVSPFVKASTGGRCCLCGAKATTTHHAFYTFKGEGDKGGYNLFPLCEAHHKEAHLKPINWVKENDHPVYGRFNTPMYLERLKAGYRKYLLCTKYNVPAPSIRSPTNTFPLPSNIRH